MAHKNARILLAVMTREEGFDRNHVSVKPKSKQPVQKPKSAVSGVGFAA